LFVEVALIGFVEIEWNEVYEEVMDLIEIEEDEGLE